jgi:hypothetical protein
MGEKAMVKKIRKFELKCKVLYQDDYKDYEKYRDAVIRWQEKGYFLMNECISSEDNECYTLLCFDGYNH